jgi:hypothetical protein
MNGSLKLKYEFIMELTAEFICLYFSPCLRAITTPL